MMPDVLRALLNDCAGRFDFRKGVGLRDGNHNARQQHGGLKHADCDDAHHSYERYFDEESPGVNFPLICSDKKLSAGMNSETKCDEIVT